MAELEKPAKPRPSPGAGTKTAYSTFPVVAPHSPHDERSYYGKPEDWKRAAPRRTIGGKTS